MEPINLHDYERLVRERMDPAAWAYCSGGSDAEVTLREERAAFERLRLVPRVLRGVSRPDPRTTVLGVPVSAPIMVAPVGVHGMAHAEGEVATARAAGDAGTLMAVSTVSTRSLEEISSAATGPLWFQLYVYRSRALAVEYGASAVDVSTHGGRQLDGVPASAGALPAVIEAVAGRAEVYLDGGVRRGTDALKALSLGARAVFVGRPVLWGLAVDGVAGARRVLELLRDELELAMALAGQPSVRSLDPDLVVRDG